MSDLIERLRASENQIAQPGYLSLATRARIEEELHQAAAELTRLRSQPTSTSEEVRQAVMSARKHVKSRTAGDGAYGEGEDCVALDLLDQLAALIESLARSEAEAREQHTKNHDAWVDTHAATLKELAAHKADAERYRWLRDVCPDTNVRAGLDYMGQRYGIDAAIDAARGK